MTSSPARPGRLVTALAAAAVPTVLWLADGARIRRRLNTARRDPLTGLWTRSGFERRARRLVERYGEGALILFLDLDGFKDLNDTYGHVAGDAVLAATARRLAAWCGPDGTAGRIGGDEFTAAVGIRPARRSIWLGQLAHQLRQPVDVEGMLIEVGVSIGAASPSDLKVGDLPSLLHGADIAMYAHKSARDGAFRIADRAMVDRTRRVNGRRLGRLGAGRPHLPSPPRMTPPRTAPRRTAPIPGKTSGKTSRKT